jgi:hypothetical protein
MADLTRDVDAILTRITELEQELRDLKAQVVPRESVEGAKGQRTSRRLLLASAGAAMAGVAVFGEARPAAADNGDPVRAGMSVTSFGPATFIYHNGTATVLGVTNDGVEPSPSPALTATANNGVAAYGQSERGFGVEGVSTHSVGVRGESFGSNAMQAEVTDTANGFNALYATTQGTGNGVFGEATRTDASANGVLGIAKGHGNSIFGYKPPATPGDAVVGAADSGRGVFGTSNAGVGVQGLSAASNGVVGTVDSTGNGFNGIYGTTKGTGNGVFGEAIRTSASASGVLGIARGSGNAVFGVKPAGTTGDAVVGQAPGGRGVVGLSTSGAGVHGQSVSGAGVIGRSTDSNGVVGHVDGTGNPFNGVYGTNAGVGNGVFGETTAAGGTGNAVLGIARGKGFAVYGLKPAGVSGDAIVGAADLGRGVVGKSSANRGGVFSGKPAQLQLVASTDSTHPASGLRGDFFLDKSSRLWFCKGGTTWTQLA